MKTYTLTIAPDDGQGTQTVVNLQLDNGRPTITGLHLVALDSTGLSANQLPAINLELLLAAIMPATTPATPAPTDAPAIAAPHKRFATAQRQRRHVIDAGHQRRTH